MCCCAWAAHRFSMRVRRVEQVRSSHLACTKRDTAIIASTRHGSSPSCYAVDTSSPHLQAQQHYRGTRATNEKLPEEQQQERHRQEDVGAEAAAHTTRREGPFKCQSFLFGNGDGQKITCNALFQSSLFEIATLIEYQAEDTRSSGANTSSG
jgi:hypothetical protein